MKMFWNIAALLLLTVHAAAQSIISDKAIPNSFSLDNIVICVDPDDDMAVLLAAANLRDDIKAVTGKYPELNGLPYADSRKLIIIGSLERSAFIKTLVDQKKININPIKGKWEAYLLTTVIKPNSDVDNALVITGSDRRGTAYGVYELSRQLGVSPWYWWADVPVKQQSSLFIKNGIVLTDAPKVKYRGIFINDEAPALSNWSKEKFGGFNHLFYEKVFELMLRLKANYLWPAMWGNAFYYDDSLNIVRADQYGIVIGTSHHEPLMRAHEEWKYFGKGRKWNYDSTEAGLKEYWKGGMQRAWNEKIVSVGMRGDGDEPMSRQTATALLERIVKDQRTIIEEVTGKPASETPQLWALYKEVQDYYDKGMRVPDDVTLLLCDDNWGNIRKLPNLNEKPRKGGYGIYYHFDYVGGPRNYKWVNTNPIPRVWEQMHLAWEYKAREIWIVNVGDIKPMEFPISFFLDYAWNPEKIGADDLQKYTEEWSAAQFGSLYAKEIAHIISTYGKYNGRRKPELLNESTYEIFSEGETVTEEYNRLLAEAEQINQQLPVGYRDAYFQLILHPVKACANLQNMYTAVARNRWSAKERLADANSYADKVKHFYANDSLITLQYHQLNKGKWNHLMSQTHIGYTYWQQPQKQVMPWIKYVPVDSILREPRYSVLFSLPEAKYPYDENKNIFYELDGYVSIEANHFTKAVNTNGITWKILPDHGRTATTQQPGGNAPHLEYEFYTYSKDSLKLLCYFSPTLNFHNSETGLQFAVSIDDENPQIINLHKEDNNVRTWGEWVSNNIIIKKSNHTISKEGKHVVKFWMVNPGVVLQKLVIDFGGVKPGYLGPPETRVEK
jgi:hypothetical protein